MPEERINNETLVIVENNCGKYMVYISKQDISPYPGVLRIRVKQ